MGSLECNSPGRIRHSAMPTAMKLTKFSRNTQPVPISPISTPEIAGPMMPARLNTIELSPTALGRCSGPTISMVNDWRVGASIAAAHPIAQATAITCQIRTSPVT